MEGTNGERKEPKSMSNKLMLFLLLTMAVSEICNFLRLRDTADMQGTADTVTHWLISGMHAAIIVVSDELMHCSNQIRK